MDSHEVWDSKLAAAAKEFGFTEGYKILYVPWATLGKSDTVFLSLNPGRPPPGADLYTLSDERGNSYEVERRTTLSPITEQFLELAKMLDLTPGQILTGVVAPFRSSRWSALAPSKRQAALQIGEEFWTQAFALKRPRRVIACCPEAARMAASILEGTFDTSMNSGWGNVSLRRYRAPAGTVIVQVPHLSTFKLFSRAQCVPPLRELLELT